MRVFRGGVERYIRCLRQFAAPREAQPVITPQMLIASVPGHYLLKDLKAGDTVFVRGDLDCQSDGKLDKEKLRSNLPLLKDLTEKRELNVILFGHKRRPDEEAFTAYAAGGRDVDPLFLHHHDSQPDQSTLRFLEAELGQKISYRPFWINPLSFQFSSIFTSWVRRPQRGKICLVGNDRLISDFYNRFNAAAEEAAEGRTTPLIALARRYYPLGKQVEDLGIKAYIYEAASASKESDGGKSALAPFVPHVALGPSMVDQMSAIQRVIGADVYSISGSKAKQKILDAITMVAEGKVEHVWTGGIVGLALAFGEAIFKNWIANDHQQLGAYSDPANKHFISPKMIKTVIDGLKKIEDRDRLDRLHIPHDFESEEAGRVLSFQPGGNRFKPNEHQFDIGPQTRQEMEGFYSGYPVIYGETRLVASGFPGWVEGGYDAGLNSLRIGAESFQDGGAILIGVGGEGRKIFNRERFSEAIGIIPGGVTNIAACGETPGAFRVLYPHGWPE